MTFDNLHIIHPADKDDRWWRKAVIYQVYPKSFRDSNGDGLGDIQGLTDGLPALAELGVDAVWLSPFYKSPQKDGGYDVTDYRQIDPIFGNCEDFRKMNLRAAELGMKTIIDLVPNHCSSENVLFQAALAAGPGSPERDMFIFRDGHGWEGMEPPNNWQSHFDGSAWTRIQEPDGSWGQHYLHLFDTSQPDWNWDNPAVHEMFEGILRFWLDLGVSGFRVDVAHALVKKQGLPDWHGRPDGGSSDHHPGSAAPMFGQPALHDIYRSWRKILDEYPGDRILCAEANVDPLPRMAEFIRPDEMNQAFNFGYLHAGWDPGKIRYVIDSSFQAFDAVGAPTTWVLSNHDVVRHASRFGLNWQTEGIGPNDWQPDNKLGLTRARAASLMMLALPGGAYLYQGEELGLPDNTMIPAESRQDPTFARSHGHRIGRDGCRVPLPWTREGASFGFNETGEQWLPMPGDWANYSREAQEGNDDSTLNLYKRALKMRKELNLGGGSFAWMPEHSHGGVVAFINGSVLVITNMTDWTVGIPNLPVIVSSESYGGENGSLEANQTVWLSLE